MSEPVPEEKLAKWEALAKAATAPPWRACVWDPMERPHVHKDATPAEEVCRPPDLPLTRADAAFVAASREAMPALIAEVRRHREEKRRALEAMKTTASRRLENPPRYCWCADGLELSCWTDEDDPSAYCANRTELINELEKSP